jgi:nucleoside-diphosphate-sugar epimerase
LTSTCWSSSAGAATTDLAQAAAAAEGGDGSGAQDVRALYDLGYACIGARQATWLFGRWHGRSNWRRTLRRCSASFIMRALAGDPIEVYGDGLQIMDMIYVTDVASILVRALEHTIEHGAFDTPLEAGSGRPTNVLEIAEKVIDAVGAGTIFHVPMRLGETPGSVVLANPQTLTPLGISSDSLTPLEVGIAATVDFYRNAHQFDCHGSPKPDAQ